MKRLSIIAFCLFVVGLLTAQFLERQKQEIVHDNLLVNPGFENSKTNWLANPVGTLTVSGTSPLDGTLSGVWDPTAASQTVRVRGLIPDYIRGKACRVSFEYSWSSGTSGHILAYVADASSNKLFADLTLSPSAKTLEAGFTCPTSGAYVDLFLSSTADAAAIKLDKAYIGPDYRFGTTNDHAELIAHGFYQGGASGLCNWQQANTTALTNFSFDADCPSITPVVQGVPVSGSTGATNLPDITLTDLPPGKYAVMAQMTVFGSSADHDHYIAMTDGTSTRGNAGFRFNSASGDYQTATITGVYEYTTKATRTFTILGGRSSGAVNILLNTIGRDLRFTVYRFPNQSPRDVVSLETQGWYVDASIGAPSGYLELEATFQNKTTPGITTFIPTPNKTNGEMVLKPGSAPAEISCANGVASSGLTCTGGDEYLLGFAFTAPKAGTYEVCLMFTEHIRLIANEVAISHWKLFKTGNTDFSTADEPDTGSAMYAYTEIGDNDERNFQNHRLCRTEKLSAGKHTYRAMWAGLTSSTVNDWNIFISRSKSANFGEGAVIHATVTPITENFPQAVAISNVPSGGTVNGCPNGENLCSGTYVPTCTALSNVSVSCSASEIWNWMRVGDVVSISGYIVTNSSVAGLPPTQVSTFKVSLPFSVDLTDGDQCTGTIAGNRNSPTFGLTSGFFRAETAADEAVGTIAATSTGNHGGAVSFSCRLKP